MVCRIGQLCVATWLVLASGCGAWFSTRVPPASHGVTAFIDTLKNDDARAAYERLSKRARGTITLAEFAKQWSELRAERRWQAARLIEAVHGGGDLGERAAVIYRDGKSVVVEREGGRWRLEAPLASRSRAIRPEDAIRAFSVGLLHRDLDAVLRSLTLRRREGLARQIEGFLAGIDGQIEGKLEQGGDDRAELRWDENGVRFRIVLRREEGEWRIDDIHVHLLPPSEVEESDEGAKDGLIF